VLDRNGWARTRARLRWAPHSSSRAPRLPFEISGDRHQSRVGTPQFPDLFASR